MVQLRHFCWLMVLVSTTLGTAATYSADPRLVFQNSESTWLNPLTARNQSSEGSLIRRVSAQSELSDDYPSESTDHYDTESDLEQRISALENELQHLRNQPRAAAPSSGHLFNCECGQDQLFGAIEVTFLQPRISGAVTPLIGGQGQLLNSELDSGLRYILGYRGKNGIGLRAQYWSYDHNSTFTATAPNQLGIQMDVVDTEVTFLQRFRRWNLGVSGGIRYARLDYETTAAGPFNIGNAVFEGAGPTVSAEARRDLGFAGLSVFGNARGAILLGDLNNTGLLRNLPVVKIKDETMQVFENQLGMAWTYDVTQTTQFELSSAWETQFWMNDTFADDTLGIGSNLSFFGPTIRCEFRF